MCTYKRNGRLRLPKFLSGRHPCKNYFIEQINHVPGCYCFNRRHQNILLRCFIISFYCSSRRFLLLILEKWFQSFLIGHKIKIVCIYLNSGVILNYSFLHLRSFACLSPLVFPFKFSNLYLLWVNWVPNLYFPLF